MSYDNIEFGLNSKESSPNREPANKHIKGSKKYKEMISEGSKAADRKNLPYQFSKPKKEQAKTTVCFCTHCNNTTAVNKNTIMVVCGSCKKTYSVTEENIIKK